jgi:hypothetical protein
MFVQKIVTLVKSSGENPMLKNPGSSEKEDIFNDHLSKIPIMIQEIQDLTLQERNILKDKLDSLILEVNLIENEIESLRARSERVYIKGDAFKDDAFNKKDDAFKGDAFNKGALS